MQDHRIKLKKELDLIDTFRSIPGFSDHSTMNTASLEGLLLENASLELNYDPPKTLQNYHMTVKAAGVTTQITQTQISREHDPKAIPLHEVIDLPGLPNAKLKEAVEYVKSGGEHYRSTGFNNPIEGEKIKITGFQVEHKVFKEPTVIQSAIDILSEQIKANDKLSPELVKEIHDGLFEQFPMLKNNQPSQTLSHEKLNSLGDVILSRTYSSNPQETAKLIKSAVESYESLSHYTADVIKAIALGIAKGDDYPFASFKASLPLDKATYLLELSEPLKIIYCQDKAELSQNLIPDPRGVYTNIDYIEGLYTPAFNIFTLVKGTEHDSFEAFFIHELGHVVMNMLFKNKATPYFAKNIDQQSEYETAKFNVFKNIGQKIGIPDEKLATAQTATNLIDMIKSDPVISGKIDHLKTSPDEGKILSEIISMINNYIPDDLTKEMIVLIPQLIAQGSSETHLGSFLKPLMDYWDKTITPQIDILFDEHQSNCQNRFQYQESRTQPLAANEMTTYCIADLVQQQQTVDVICSSMVPTG